MKKIILYFLIIYSLYAVCLEDNYYDTLEIPIDASQEEITIAYRRKAQLYHPDRNTSHHAEGMMKKINKAYSILKDPNIRLKYDREFFEDNDNFSQTEPTSSDANMEDLSNFNSIEEFLTKYPDPEKRRQLVKYIYGLKDEINMRKVLNVLVQDPDPTIRKELAKYIHSLQNTEIAIEFLYILQQDPDPSVRAAVATYINKFSIQTKTEILNTFTKDPDPSVRKEVIREAVNLNTPEGEAFLDTLMEDTDPTVRGHIPFALTNLVPYTVRTAPGLLHQLKSINRFKILMIDPVPDVRKGVARYISLLKDTTISEEILNTLIKDPDPIVRKEVIHGAVQIEGAIGESLLEILMTDFDPTVRMHIPFELTRYYSLMESKSIVRKFKILMADPVSTVRIETARYAGQLRNRKASFQILSVLIRDPYLDVREGVIIGAVKLGGYEGERLLNRLMKEQNPKIKTSIIYEIFRLYSTVDEKRRVTRLQNLVKDTNPSIRTAAASAVTLLKSKVTAEKILNTLIYDPNMQVIQQVMKSAIYLGNNIVKRIIEKILTSHPDRDVRKKVFGLVTEPSSNTQFLESDLYNSGTALTVIDFNNIKKTFSNNTNRITNLMEVTSKIPMDIRSFKNQRRTKKTLRKNYPDPKSRRKLIKQAVKIGGSVGENILDALITDPDPTVRKWIPFQLSKKYSKINKIKSLHIFKVLMLDPDPTVRESVAEYIVNLKSRAQIIEILNTLSIDASPNVKKGVIKGAVKLHGGEYILNILMRDPNPVVRKFIVIETVNSIIDKASALKIFKHLMKDPVPDVRERVAQLSPYLKDQVQTELILSNLINDPVPGVRIGAVIGALFSGGSVGENILNIGITDPDPTVRKAIAIHIPAFNVKIRTELIFSTLKILSTDLSPDVRKSVAQFVRFWKHKTKAEEILMLLTTDTNLNVIQQVMSSAIGMGIDVAQRVISKIFYAHSNPNTRREAYQYARTHQIDVSGKTTQENVNNRQPLQKKSCESIMSK